MIKLKYIGFIKEHDDNIAESLSFNDITRSVQANDLQELLKIVDYLERGPLLLAWMNYTYDLKTNLPIGPNSFHTDGVWVWPSYLSYYLTKFPHYPINREFVDHLYFQNFKTEKIDKEDMALLAEQVILYFSQRKPLRNET